MTTSPMRTSAAAISTLFPSRRTIAESGATATSSARADRVLFIVAASRACPTAKSAVTAAASQKLPMSTAPIAAIDTSRSMLMNFVIRARKALTAILYPATFAAASMSRFASVKTCPDPWACSPASIHHCGPMVRFHAPPRSFSTPKERRMRIPARTGTDQFPNHHLRSRFIAADLSGRRARVLPRVGCLARARRRERGLSECRGGRRVSGFGDGGDDVVDRSLRLVVVDFDACRGDVHRHGFDTGELADLLLDLLHARGAGEAFCAKQGVG